jgi:hypothetical protein
LVIHSQIIIIRIITAMVTLPLLLLLREDAHDGDRMGNLLGNIPHVVVEVWVEGE